MDIAVKRMSAEDLPVCDSVIYSLVVFFGHDLNFYRSCRPVLSPVTDNCPSNQRKGENGHRNFFMTKSKECYAGRRIEPATVRIPSDRATAPGLGKKDQELIYIFVRMNFIAMSIF